VEIGGVPYGFGDMMTTLLIELPHSRKKEYEGLYLRLPAKSAITKHLPVPIADKIGLKLSAKACYDPTAAPLCGSIVLCASVAYASSTQDV
jgi:hypothetical protein